MKRTPKSLVNGLSIFCHQLRKEGLRLNEIAIKAGLKDHSEVCYHIKRYNDMIDVNPNFKREVKDFRMEDFKEQYLKFRLEKSKAQKERIRIAEINDVKKLQK